MKKTTTPQKGLTGGASAISSLIKKLNEKEK